MENYFKSLSILKLIFKWKIQLIIITGLTLLLSMVFSSSYFIKPRYKSSAIMYPSNISPYSEESQSEQMLQIFQSTFIRDTVIEKFNLISHYEIDTTYPKWRSWLQGEWDKNVKISKTQFEGVEMNVLDTDPVMARDIVNGLMDAYNNYVRQLQQNKFGEVVAMLERQLARKHAIIDSLTKRYTDLSMKYGLVDYNSQSREISRGTLRTTGGGSVNVSEVNRIQKNILEKGGEMLYIRDLLGHEASLLANIEKEYDIAMMNYDRRYTYINLISAPEISDKKASPVRWLIVASSLISVLLISLIVISIIDDSARKSE